MTRKIYKSAMGKTVDMGSLLLQNEQVRAVGNMNINARGDRLDSNNRVTEPKNRQVQRKYNKQTNVSGGPAATSTVSVKQKDNAPGVETDTFADLPVDDPVVAPAMDNIQTPVVDNPPAPVVDNTPAPVEQVTRPVPAQGGGLAGAIARTREVKQELEKTQRQKLQAQGVRKI
jgi:hypothetical protein